MKNVWDYDIPRIDEIIDRPELHGLVSDVTHKMLGAVGQPASAAQETIDFLFSKNSPRKIFALERALHTKIFSEGENQNKVREGMWARANTISSEISKYFKGETLADVGCGHGLVGWSARQNFSNILLLDIIDYRYKEVTLPFVEYSENEAPPLGGAFDCTLLITVLHHAHDPMRLLQSVWSQTRKRLIVIESVFGVDSIEGNSPLISLDQHDQLCYAVYCDWFYNRVLNQDVVVPYNFNTPDNWHRIFSKLSARVSVEENLGVDLNIVPEHHFLFVLDRDE